MEAAVIVTYRCNARCHMCNTWKYPTKPEEEIQVEHMDKLPSGLDCVNITGGEPLLRKDIEDVVGVLSRKTKRIEISTNGYFTDKIVNIARKYRNITIRVSLGGLPKIGDEVMGIKDGFDHGLRTILQLKELRIRDIGFAITVSDQNAKSLMDVYSLAKAMKVELATAVAHNSFYFHKFDNEISDKDAATGELKKLVREFLKSRNIKAWFRAYYNYGLMKFINGERRPLSCNSGNDLFFVDPYGDVYPCNVMKESMGNIKEKSFDEIWDGERAREVREKVENCPLNCWMTGTAGPAMKHRIWKPTSWILRNKFRLLFGRDIVCD